MVQLLRYLGINSMNVGWVVALALLIVLYAQSRKPRKPDFVYVITKCYKDDEDQTVLVLCSEKEAKDWVELRNKELELDGTYYKYEEMELDGED